MKFKLQFERSPKNPILSPTEHWWESRAVCNPGVVEIGGRIHLIYTAKGEDEIARFGYAILREEDEVEERFSSPIFLPMEWFEADGVEDPRLIQLDERIYMIYAGKERDMARICESFVSVSDFLAGKWTWSKHRLLLPVMVGIHNRNAAYFPRKIGGRYVLLHRPMTMAEHIWVSFSYDRIHWYDHRELMRPRPGYWDDAKVGIAGPPIELDIGWLLIYHGVEARTWTYRLGYAVLSKERPWEVIYRCEDPILEPREEYEREGVSPNVVFSCGAVVRDKKLILYYGAADKYICVATADLA